MSLVALVLVLFAATAGLRWLADRWAVPLPSLLVLGGVVLALVPGLPRANFAPDAIFLLFVPPLLYWAALTTSLRDLHRNLRAIVMLAVVLVLVTMGAVAVCAHALLPSLSWPMCFLLGAVVSPPDAVAVTAVTRRLQLPRDLVVVLEGESLINDATALVAYQIALGAALTGHFSLPAASLQLLLTGLGGVAVGLLSGWLIGRLRLRIRQSSVVENTVSLLTPFIAYLPASAIGVSGILAVVTAGLYLGRRGPHVISAATRLQATAMWEMLTFLLEGLIFIFIGLELPSVVHNLKLASMQRLSLDALLIATLMMVVRLIWVFAGTRSLPWIGRQSSSDANRRPWRAVLFAGWAGIRGGDSLVIALAIPLVNASGAPLAGREAVIFITFAIILLTLVVQGFTLAPAIRWLGLRGGREEDAEELKARRAAVHAGLQALSEASNAADFDPDSAQLLRDLMQQRLEGLTRSATRPDSNPPVPSMARLRIAMIAAQRQAVVQLRDQGHISDGVMRRLQSELDHEEVLLHQRFD